MAPLVSSDFAAVTTGTALYLYYQQGDGIIEVHSNDGEKWTAGISLASKKLAPAGSPITAFYVQHDGSLGSKPTIHVIYIDKEGALCEQTRAVTDSKWQQLNMPADISRAPLNTSRLASGVCHDNTTNLSHQWVYFVEDIKGIVGIGEIRKADSSKWKWAPRKFLPENPAQALPGTNMGSNFTGPENYLFIQDHNGDVVEYTAKQENETWNEGTTVIKNSSAIINTPLTCCNSPISGKPHVFYVSNHDHVYYINDYLNGKTSELPKCKWAPGTRIGAANMNGVVYLFYKDPVSPMTVSTMLYRGGEWRNGKPVIT